MRGPDIKIHSPEDITPALKDLLKSSKFRCAGTINQVDGRKLPCVGGGLCVSEFYETEVLPLGDFNLDTFEALIESGGIKVPDGVVLEKMAHLHKVMACPCESQAEESAEQDQLKVDLAVDKMPNPNEKQLAALRLFRDEHKSLYIYGSPDAGKTYLAYLCAKSYKGMKRVFVNTKLSEFFRKNSHELTPADFKGLVICDDIQENLPSPFFQSALFEALDLVKRRKLRMIIVANLTPQEFVDRYATEELRKPQFENRLNKMEIIKL